MSDNKRGTDQARERPRNPIVDGFLDYLTVEKGLAPLVRRRCDAVAAIPQHGTLPSLNVGVAGAVACFEVARQRSAGATRR